MITNRVRSVCLLCCSLALAYSASAQQVKPTPPPDATQQALQQFTRELRELWLSGLLSYDQKIDLGRLCEQIEAAGAGDRPVPLALAQEKIRLLQQVVSPQQREQARQAATGRRRAAQRQLLATFSMKWPQPLQAKWEQAYLDAEKDLSRELADRRAMQAQVAADVKRNPRLHGTPGKPEPGKPRRDVYSRPAGIELYIRQMEFTPYFGQRFDEQVLADPALSDAQRHELNTIILSKALGRRMGQVPLLAVFRSLQFTPDQLQRFRSALEVAEAELRSALAAQTMEISSTGDLQLWFRQALKRETDFDRLLTARQKKSLALAERIRRARPMMWFSLDEIEPELIDGIVKILNRFDAQIADIPKTQWGRNMVYQEAKLDRDSGILRLVMSSKQLSPRRKGQIAKPSLDACFTFLSRFFPPNLERVLNTWPASLPVELPGDPTTVESLTPQHWFRIYEILAQESIWDAVKDAQLTVYATLFAAQATDGKAMEMQMLREYKINRASYRFAEALFADPAFTPLQKLLLYEAFWNRVGPYIGYFYALDLDADVFYERLLEMRRLLAFISSAAPYTQGIFSISDIAERQKTSLKSAKRWTEIGGHFSEEEMEVLQARYDELMARLEEWGRYQPPDPNKPAEPAPPPPPEQLE